MKKRLTALLLAAAAALALCGCGNLYDKEYLAVSTYAPAQADTPDRAERISVRNLAELKDVLQALVFAGAGEGSIVFDLAYDGDVVEDMASACWQVRTQDALCAYCVDNISYELNKIVTYYEADLSIAYTEAGQDQSSIVRMQYTTGIEERIRRSIQTGEPRLVVLIQRSSYSAENMESLVGRIYRAHPLIAPQEPQASVNMFSGTGTQRLYEINFDYGLDEETLPARMEELAGLTPFADLDTGGMGAAYKALAACEYLASNCDFLEAGKNTVYDALINRKANSEGMALAYVALCEQLGVRCQIVSGQRNWQEHCWNIVEIEGAYYHVDPAICAQEGLEAAFLLGDEAAWASYRWDVSAYPRCTGELTYAALLAAEFPPEDTEEAP